MALYVIATPIGNDEDISLRARRTLEEADLVIGEEAKVTRRLLKRLEVPIKRIELLNEHSTMEDIRELVGLCQQNDKVALISDCGTPGFCDPGAELVHFCRQAGVSVRSVPGPSSLMTFLSISGRRLPRFYFRGFLPAKSEERKEELHQLKQAPEPIILMDTPYRLKKLLSELESAVPHYHCVLGLNLSKDDEAVLTGTAKDILNNLPVEKAEFILLIEPPQRNPKKSTAPRRRTQSSSAQRKGKRQRRGKRIK